MSADTQILIEGSIYLFAIIGAPFIWRITMALWDIFFGLFFPERELTIEVEYDGKVTKKVISIDDDEELIEALCHIKRRET